MTRVQILLVIGVAAVVLVNVFVLLAAAWNRENDEAAQRLADRHYRDNENPEGDES